MTEQTNKSGKWFCIELAEAGDIIDARGDTAKIVEVYPGYGAKIETISPGYKLHVVYSISEFSMRGTKFV